MSKSRSSRATLLVALCGGLLVACAHVPKTQDAFIDGREVLLREGETRKARPIQVGNRQGLCTDPCSNGPRQGADIYLFPNLHLRVLLNRDGTVPLDGELYGFTWGVGDEEDFMLPGYGTVAYYRGGLDDELRPHGSGFVETGDADYAKAITAIFEHGNVVGTAAKADTRMRQAKKRLSEAYARLSPARKREMRNAMIANRQKQDAYWQQRRSAGKPAPTNQTGYVPARSELLDRLRASLHKNQLVPSGAREVMSLVNVNRFVSGAVSVRDNIVVIGVSHKADFTELCAQPELVLAASSITLPKTLDDHLLDRDGKRVTLPGDRRAGPRRCADAKTLSSGVRFASLPVEGTGAYGSHDKLHISTTGTRVDILAYAK